MRNYKRLCCPTCHQTLVGVRAGVRLPALKVEIFDAIKAAGDVGISSQELMCLDAYRDRHKPPSRHTITSHLYQINDMLAETDLVIVSTGVGNTNPPPHWILTSRKRRGRPKC